MSANAETMTGALREEDAPLFVINLCASTTPVALTQPSSPELKRYTFFVTRRREEGRERFACTWAISAPSTRPKRCSPIYARSIRLPGRSRAGQQQAVAAHRGRREAAEGG